MPKLSIPLSDIRSFSCIKTSIEAIFFTFGGHRFRLICLSWKCVLVFMRKIIKDNYQDT